MSILILLLSLGLLLWLAAIVWNLANAQGVVTLSAEMDFPLSDFPRISILIPARNEAEMLASTLPGVLQQDYPNYEVILVDDSSTDRTAEVAEQFRLQYPDRLRVLRAGQLPAGWVGKNFALHTAFQAARCEWILATDADIVFHPKALQAGLWLARKQRADLVSIFAFTQCESFWEKLLLPGFSLMLATFFPFRKINDARSSVALASGGYILLRRGVWESLGGYPAIRSEMIDDLNTARLVKHSGHRIFAAITRNLLSTRMYEDFREVWEGLRKNAFAGNRYSEVRILTGIGLVLLTNALPLGALSYAALRLMKSGAGGAGAWQLEAALALSCAQYLMAAGLHAPFVRYLGVGRQYALLAPLGSIVYACISLDSMIRTVAGEGVSWKLRQYPKPPETVNGDKK